MAAFSSQLVELSILVAHVHEQTLQYDDLLAYLRTVTSNVSKIARNSQMVSEKAQTVAINNVCC
jgi:hypothetical protein